MSISRTLRRGASLLSVTLGAGLTVIWATAFIRNRARRLVRLGHSRAVGLPLEDDGPESLPGFLWQATGDRLVPGNRVLWHFDAGIFDAIHDAVDSAEHSVRVALYIWKPGNPGTRIAEACCRAAERGVRVQIVVDPLGSKGFAEELLERLQQAGCEVRAFRKPGAVSALRLAGRLHRKLVVIDDRIAFTGGFGFGPEWVQQSEAAPVAWRDTHARVEGPVVVDFLQAFASSWLEAAGKLLHLGTGPQRPPPLPLPPDTQRKEARHEERDGAGERVRGPEERWSADAPLLHHGASWAGFVASRESSGWTDSFLLLWLSMVSARSRLWVANAYFAPPAELLELLCHKAREGVDVRLLLPGPFIDHVVSRWAQRSTYAPLLAAGARVFEYQPTMMHGKTLLVDDRLSLVGSINMDPFSLYWLEEGSLVVDDRRVAAELAAQWERDERASEEIGKPPKLALLHPERWGPKSLPRRLSALLG